MLRIIKSKKGLADIIAVVLIIALSTIAASLIWSYTSKTTSVLSPELNCLDSQINRVLTIEKACATNGELELTLNSKIKSSDFEVILSGENQITAKGGQSCEGAKNINEGKNTFSVQLNNQIFEEATILINNCNLDTRTINPC